jgi:hypothetical protein
MILPVSVPGRTRLRLNFESKVLGGLANERKALKDLVVSLCSWIMVLSLAALGHHPGTLLRISRHI